MEIIKAEKGDLPRLREIYAYARNYMRETGNPNQWMDGSPKEELLLEDIAAGNLYVIKEGEVIHGVFAFVIGKDATYRKIEQGSWFSEEEYGTIHRVAGDGEVKGLFDRIVKFCSEKKEHLRIDTHADNRVMQHLIEKNGFKRCGIIHIADGSPRIAYERTGESYMLQLIKFDRKYAPQLNEMMDEWTAANEKIIPWAIRKCDYHDIDRYIDSLEVKKAEGKYVPNSTFFCIDTERNIFVGAVNIRHYMNEQLVIGAGHIGCGIRPSERGKGIGTQMLALAIEKSKKLGINRILICCDKDNIASARTIIKNGGVLENEVIDEGVLVQRYWIERGKEYR